MTEVHLHGAGKIEVPQKGSWVKAGTCYPYFNLHRYHSPGPRHSKMSISSAQAAQLTGMHLSDHALI
jgi:hypothetical protein